MLTEDKNLKEININEFLSYRLLHPAIFPERTPFDISKTYLFQTLLKDYFFAFSKGYRNQTATDFANLSNIKKLNLFLTKPNLFIISSKINPVSRNIDVYDLVLKNPASFALFSSETLLRFENEIRKGIKDNFASALSNLETFYQIPQIEVIIKKSSKIHTNLNKRLEDIFDYAHAEVLKEYEKENQPLTIMKPKKALIIGEEKIK